MSDDPDLPSDLPADLPPGMGADPDAVADETALQDGQPVAKRSRWRGRARSDLSLVQLLPNLMTVAALCAGLAAIKAAAAGRFVEAVLLILLAAVLDGLDGRLARFLKSESLIGAELDSLADFLNFGVATGFIVYFWAFPGGSNLGWGAVLAYVVCCVMRLARFNVGNSLAEDLARQGKFQGVPSPAGAMLALMPLYFGFLWPQILPLPPLAVALHLVVVGFLMISRIPTPSLKRIRVPTDRVSFVIVAGVVVVYVIISYPWAMLSALSLSYAVVVLFAWARSLTAKRV